MSRGGARAGAGRKPGGISHTRRLLVSAIDQGLVIAGRSKGLIGDDMEVATASAAQIVADEIKSGRGADILKLAAMVAIKDSDESGAGNSPLSAALGKLPGFGKQKATVTIQNETEQHENGLGNGIVDGGAQYQQYSAPKKNSNSQPFFTPQKTLPLAAQI